MYAGHDIKEDLESHKRMSRAKDIHIEDLESRLRKDSAEKEKLQEVINSLEDNLTKKEEQLFFLKQAQESSEDATLVTDPNKKSSLLPSIDGMLRSNHW